MGIFSCFSKHENKNGFVLKIQNNKEITPDYITLKTHLNEN